MLRILTYHRVGQLVKRPSLNPRLISATPQAFAVQIEYLARRYRVVSIRDVLRAVERRANLPRRAVLLTFDDGYRDFAEIAWPILKKWNLPVVLFVPTAFPSQPELAFWWDRLYRAVAYTEKRTFEHPEVGTFSLKGFDTRSAVLKRLQDYAKTLPHAELDCFVERVCQALGDPVCDNGVLSWPELRQLSREGVDLAPHTMTHPLLTRVPIDVAKQEVWGSREDLIRRIGKDLAVFSYPNGSHNDEVVEVLRRQGFRAAFATHEGRPFDTRDYLRILRLNINRRTTPGLFRLRLTPLGMYLEQKLLCRQASPAVKQA